MKGDVTEAIVPRLVAIYGLFITSGTNKQRKRRSGKNVVGVFVGHWGSRNIASRQLANVPALSREDAETLRCRVRTPLVGHGLSPLSTFFRWKGKHVVLMSGFVRRTTLRIWVKIGTVARIPIH